MKMLAKYYEENKKWLYFALGATFFWGLLAHAYCFFDNSFSHDSLNELHGAIFGNEIRMFSGRVFVPLYRDLVRSDVTLPWLIGVLALFWMGLAVYCVIKTFRLESKITAFLIAGIFATNTTVSGAAATYLHDLDCFMVSLLCAAAAVCLWKRHPKGWLLGAPLIAVSLGMYQSFVFTAISLVMMASLLALMEGESFRQVFAGGLKAIGMVALGGGGYFAALKVIVPLSGVALSSGYYNSMDLALEITLESLPGLVGNAYGDWFERFWTLNSSYPTVLVRGMTVVIFGIGAVALVVWLLDKKAGLAEKLLGLVLVGLLPLMMNMLEVLTLGANHDLMVFAVWLTWLLAVLLADWLRKKWQGRLGGWQRAVCLGLVAVLMYGNVQLANGMYLKKDLEYDAYLSLMTRVADRMESCEGYVPGETPVIFIGLPKHMLNEVMPGFKDYWNITGMGSSDVIFMPERERYRAYFDYVLGVPMTLAEGEVWTQGLNSEFAEQMEKYPAQGCVALKDGVLYVKLGDRGTDREE